MRDQIRDADVPAAWKAAFRAWNAEVRRTEPRRIVRARRTRLAIAGIAVLAMIAPGVVLASHEFIDVPDDQIFHENIDNIADAGITSGCSTGAYYCPEDFVQRDQMAAFLNRGLGRGASARAFNVTLGSTPKELVGANVTTPGAGFILVVANMTAFPTEGGNCPCLVRMHLKADGLEAAHYAHALIATAETVNMGNNWLFPIAAGGGHHLSVQIARSFGTSPFSVNGAISAIWIPFDGVGNSNDPFD